MPQADSPVWAPHYGTVSYRYDAGGRLLEKWLPNGVTAHYIWNADFTLASCTILFLRRIRQSPPVDRDTIRPSPTTTTAATRITQMSNLFEFSGASQNGKGA
ncbi:MAG: hypothetical protein HY272_09850 [Gammaproteobacteria bacterium]|nr:hypothetical protein [Gammaproteobacteria bacterium]